jgi:hypothetical protein
MRAWCTFPRRRWTSNSRCGELMAAVRVPPSRKIFCAQPGFVLSQVDRFLRNATAPFHSAVPTLRTTHAACLHRLSTDLCTAWIDAGGDWQQTVLGVGLNAMGVVRRCRRPLGPSASHGFSRGLLPPRKGACSWNQPACTRASRAGDGGAGACLPPDTCRSPSPGHRRRAGPVLEGAE